ncbi:MAG: entericidin A/B family lipoprotein [Alphaproteobacteria bacterium]|nr:entericidin A/B family lipoprotein [Alphaproteobacteria bacterium]MBF0332708.1 entericidin A/B family lipoprotein [Alphaproteobacteria bacterium]MBF0372921.1 entericidin A/B family lipoprotein [Alphaproteobacteria bacterium]MBF0391910.1 entericidin A/B family lipoprotein [Alphaproteobacteria bacterium]
MALVAAAMLLAGCNTFSGMGQDLQSAGKSVERTAERTK